MNILILNQLNATPKSISTRLVSEFLFWRLHIKIGTLSLPSNRSYSVSMKWTIEIKTKSFVINVFIIRLFPNIQYFHDFFFDILFNFRSSIASNIQLFTNKYSVWFVFCCCMKLNLKSTEPVQVAENCEDLDKNIHK